jgi:hypothetical protein
MELSLKCSFLVSRLVARTVPQETKTPKRISLPDTCNATCHRSRNLLGHRSEGALLSVDLCRQGRSFLFNAERCVVENGQSQQAGGVHCEQPCGLWPV